jgi:ribonuclease HI
MDPLEWIEKGDVACHVPFLRPIRETLCLNDQTIEFIKPTMSIKRRTTQTLTTAEILTPTARAEQAEQQLAEALQCLEQERQRSQALEAKLRELKVPLDFLAAAAAPKPAASPVEFAIADSGTALIKAIYTDGACSGNPGPGGWGTVIYLENGTVRELGGYAPATTNNRMEMQAAIAALDFLLASGQTVPTVLLTDSEYVKNGITKWIKGWKQKGWKTATGKPVLNQDLWEALDERQLKVNRQLQGSLEWQYVRGHVGNVGNERADAIARAFSQGRSPDLA